jgi:hypothetical protein
MALEFAEQDSIGGDNGSQIFVYHPDIPRKVMEAFPGLGCVSQPVVPTVT